MSNKEKCKEIMRSLFGDASAAQVDEMSEETCVDQCKQKVREFLGSEMAEKSFANL